jgi:ribosomal protein S18 acetylase RimI-like enzyme
LAVFIRRLGPGDEELLELLARDAADFDLAGRSAPDQPLGQDEAVAYLANEGVLHWIAESEEVVVGELICHLLPLSVAPGREVLLYSVGVREAYRRQGIGRALVNELRRWCELARVRDVWVLADNAGAEAFYRSCGFRLGEEREQGVLYLLEISTAESA